MAHGFPMLFAITPTVMGRLRAIRGPGLLAGLIISGATPALPSDDIEPYAFYGMCLADGNTFERVKAGAEALRYPPCATGLPGHRRAAKPFDGRGSRLDNPTVRH